jgi:integrase
MQANASLRKPGADTYRKVYDSRRRRVRGMWQRHGRFFANLTVADDLGRKSSRMVPLNGATFEEAKDDHRRLMVERDDDRLRPLGLTPTLADYLTAHTQRLALSGKRPASVEKETAYLNRCAANLGHLRLNKVRPHHLSTWLAGLAEQEYAPRSINLHLIAVRGLFKAAMRDGHVKPPLPFEGLGWQRVDQKSRQLYTPEEINELCDVATLASKNGRQFVDYVRFLQYSGARRSEALRVRWQDVDFERGHVTIGAEGDSKNREARHVDFNPALQAHLEQMVKYGASASQWLFPSPQRGERDVPSATFMESLRLTRLAGGCVCKDCGKVSVGKEPAKCGHCGSERVDRRERLLSPKLQRLGFHDLRHHFISYAVMSGVDFMTIAGWVGHKDGGILIGKVYGHLADEHRKRQAARVSFGLTLLPAAAAS